MIDTALQRPFADCFLVLDVVFTQGTLPPIKDDERGAGTFRLSNRKKIPAADLKKLAPQQRSRYLAVSINYFVAMIPAVFNIALVCVRVCMCVCVRACAHACE